MCGESGAAAGHALMCAAPPPGPGTAFLKKLGTFFNLGTIFNFYSSTTVISGREVGAPALVAWPSPGLDATISPITDFQLN